MMDDATRAQTIIIRKLRNTRAKRKEQTVKTKLGVIIIMFLIGLIIGATQPALLYAGGETRRRQSLGSICTTLTPF